MKKQLHFIIFFCLLSFLSCFSIAQDTTKIKLSKWGITINGSNAGLFQKLWLNDFDIIAAYPGYFASGLSYGGKAMSINNYAVGLAGYYLLNNHMALRVKAQVAKNNINSSDNTKDYISSSVQLGPGTTFTSGESNVKQTITSFEPNFIWNTKIKKITIYEGLTLPFILIGKYKSTGHYAETDYVSNIVINEGTSENSLPGGFATGMGLISGLDFSISDRLKFGTEFSFAYLYSHVIGEQTFTTTTSIPAYRLETTTGPFTRVRYEFSNINAAINISFSF